MKKLNLLQFIKVIKWVISLYMQISPFRTTFLVLSRALQTIRNLVIAFIFGKLIDEVARQIASDNPSLTEIYPFLLYLLIYYVIFEGIINELSTYCRRSLRHLSRRSIEVVFYKKLNEIGIQTLENPGMQNKVKRADEWLRDSEFVLEQIVELISGIALAITSAFVIYKYVPSMVPILVIYAVIRFLPERHFSKLGFNWQVDNTEKSRMNRVLANYLSDPKELLEIKINSAFRYLDQKIEEFYKWYNAGMLRIIKNSHLASFGLGTGQSIFGIAGYLIIIRKTILQNLTLGDMTFQFRAFDSFASSLSGVLDSFTWMYDISIKMTDVVDVFEAVPEYKDGTIKFAKMEAAPEIEFRNVTFRYPGSSKNVFENLNMKFNSGSNIALVGHNGAGKTTIVKLLARVYRSSEGQILINGININDLSIEDWYKHIGILFQEYAFYPSLNVRENIVIGDPEKKSSEKEMLQASINAEADEFIKEYKNGYDQLMSEQYEGGIRPSTGQKQKIAIARFFFRNPKLAIFDEPTSSIDAVSEYRIFNKIYEFFRRKTVLIISHRFSTVRNADIIFVIDKGKIIESGSHDELMKAQGYYANAFNLQAKGYM